MRPSKLVFNGINSFSERTEIDFDRLTANGLFGIFGETGSGKSTVLDCINFALYGNVDRSKKKTDIINYNCDQAEVEFEFTLLSQGVRRRYRVERSIKKKNGLGKAMLYVYEAGKCECVADNTTSVNSAVEELLGLNAEDFRKCIALPQGEFAQFVKCAPAERFKIIERLFSLSRYGEGLKENIAKRESEIEAEYLKASGELSAYSDVTAQSVEESATKLKEYINASAELEKQGKPLKVEAERLNGVYKSRTELDAAEKEFSIQLSREEEMGRLRKIIKSLPQCKRVAEIDDELTKTTAECNEEKKEAERIDAELTACGKRLEKLTAETDNAAYEDQITSLKGKLAAFEASNADITELAETDKKLKTLRCEFKTAVVKGDKLRDEECAAFKAAELLKKRLDECAKEDLGEILETKLKPAILRQEFVDQLVYFGDLRESIKDYDNDGYLYKFLRGELTDRIKYYEQKIRSLQTEKVNVDEVISAFKEQSAMREKLLKEYEESKDKLAACKQNSAVCDNDISVLKRDGEQLKERYLRLKAKLDDLFGESENGYAATAAALNAKCENLVKLHEKAVNDIKISKERLAELKIASGKSAVKILGLEGSAKSLKRKLDEALKESGYNSAEECRNVLIMSQSHKNAESELSGYDEKVVALKAKIAALKAVEGINSVDINKVNEANEKLRVWEASVKETHAQVRVAENNYKQLSEKLAKKTKNEAALKSIESRRNVLQQLKELTRGNKFLEYIAGEYLSDISKAASVTLLKLTGGRYFLVYDDSFYVGDNYNEGNKRGVNTLSGGEIFLVSLSLALALSSAICKGSLKSIEFFFLDEGFGTLDESLVDTVMDSLEKLRSAEFTIGIISHVEELKHRIESKIIVNKATETRGSSVNVYV